MQPPQISYHSDVSAYLLTPYIHVPIQDILQLSHSTQTPHELLAAARC